MSHTYSKILLHAVFSTKQRRPLIDDAWRDRLYSYIGGIVRENGAGLLRAGGVTDHVHLLLETKTSQSPSDLMRIIKTNSSSWLHDDRLSPAFAWQTGYGIFSVSRSQQDAVVDYIDGQAEHHRRQSFQDELCALLKRHEIEFDEQYLWD